jgi:uncharacterized sulfatase
MQWPIPPNTFEAAARRVWRGYLGCITHVDHAVGLLLRALDELGFAENTIVIYTSDHGYNIGHHGIWHKGNGHWMLTKNPPGTENIPAGQRPNMFDTSLRVPAVVRWPRAIPTGNEVDETISHLDWFPTLLAAADVPLPDGATIHGHNFLPLLKGEPVKKWSNDLYTEYSTHAQSRSHMRCYRTPTWKLISDLLNPGRDELYNLKDDPGETRNLIDSTDAAAQAALADLDARLKQRMRELNDPVLAAP